MKIRFTTGDTSTMCLWIALFPGAVSPWGARAAQSGSAAAVQVTIDPANVVNTMRGGIGASWHAIEKPIPIGHGGSGWGGYPPPDDERAWQQIYRHASWLGIDWNRVEVEQRIYEPERGRFTFDSTEMRILYRILDWNQQHGANVFFQQMWVNADWLAYPAAVGNPVARVHSAPRDLQAFADGLATLMDYLVNKKRYTCIKWLSITNEPGANWSWWQGPAGEPLPLGAGLTAVQQALAHRGVNLPLSGPDAGVDLFHAVLSPDDALHLGAYDFHDYDIRLDSESGGYLEKQVRKISDWVKFAHVQNKPVFLSEFGTLDWPEAASDSRPNRPENVLAASEFILRDANAGVDGFNRWSFLNRGDLDGQWQFVDTFDPKRKALLAEFSPHPNSYFGLGLLSRFTAKHSAVLATEVRDSGARQHVWDKKGQHVFCAAFRSPGGNLTLAMVNDGSAASPVKVAWAGKAPSARFFRYRFGRPEFGRRDVKVDPDPDFSSPRDSTWTDTLPPQSLTVYSTFHLKHDDPGVVDDGAGSAKH